MSAFVCSDYHVSILAVYGARKGQYGTIRAEGRDWADPREIFAVLMQQNIRSVQHRYPDHNGQADKFGDCGRFDKVAIERGHSPVEVIKAAHCLEYQSCETDDYLETLAYKLLQQIKRRAEHNLSGYDSAKWTLDR